MSDRITISILFVFITVFMSNFGYAETSEESDLGYVPGELLVRFKPNINGRQRGLSEKKQILNSLNAGTVERSFKIVPGLTLVKLPAGQTVEDALQTFKNVDEILHTQPNYTYKLLSTFPDDTRFDAKNIHPVTVFAGKLSLSQIVPETAVFSIISLDF